MSQQPDDYRRRIYGGTNFFATPEADALPPAGVGGFGSQDEVEQESLVDAEIVDPVFPRSRPETLLDVHDPQRRSLDEMPIYSGGRDGASNVIEPGEYLGTAWHDVEVDGEETEPVFVKVYDDGRVATAGYGDLSNPAHPGFDPDQQIQVTDAEYNQLHGFNAEGTGFAPDAGTEASYDPAFDFGSDDVPEAGWTGIGADQPQGDGPAFVAEMPDHVKAFESVAERIPAPPVINEVPAHLRPSLPVDRLSERQPSTYFPGATPDSSSQAGLGSVRTQLGGPSSIGAHLPKVAPPRLSAADVAARYEALHLDAPDADGPEY